MLEMSDARQTNPGDTLTDDDVARILELADGHLEDAENVLWNASKDVEGEALREDLEVLTRAVWDLQHKVDDVKRDL